MLRRTFLALAGVAVLAASAGPAAAQDALKVGLILPMTGPSASTGRQVDAAVRLFLAERGPTVAGRTVEVVLRDDGGVADTTKRLAQELIVNDGAEVLMGFGLTPLALAAAPLATRGKVPMIVTSAATATITEASPFIVRTSFTLPQATVPMAQWANDNGLSRVVTLVTDYGPGVDAEKAFSGAFKGEVVNLRVPLQNPDFSPFLQRVADAKPEAVFVFVPSGFGAQFMKQYVERGLPESGIRLIGTGDVVDDDLLAQIGDVAVGMVTTHHYSAAHDSPENKAFVQAFEAANSFRPNFMAVGGYDAMALLYAALEKTGGKTGAELVEAMKGQSWTSPRGPVTIDPETRDIIQNVYVRETKSVDGQLYNVEFATVEQVKDPVKAAK